MINVEFDRNNYKVECGGCGVEIQPEAPSWRLDFGVENNMAEQTVCLCEDCGNNLQNDMSDEYCKFVNL